MKLIFCGTPQFAVPTLERLLAGPFKIELVITNPDEASGRGYELQAPPVKRAALERRLAVFQPARLKDAFARAFVSEFHPDALVVVAYGHLLPSWMIELARLGAINLHASLLPKYRGAAPIPWAIMRGERVTGVTTMQIDAGMDTGDILLCRETPIEENDTAESLGGRLANAGAELMAETLERLARGELKGRPQDHTQATLAPRLKKEDGCIDWRQPATEIERRVRGLKPWPGATSTFRGQSLHVWKSRVSSPLAGAHEPGTLSALDGRLVAVCGDGTALELLEVQREGRRRVSAREFLNGVRLQPGEKLETPSP